jgi:hypothetical protein
MKITHSHLRQPLLLVATVAAVLALGACKKGDDTNAGNMATPPAASTTTPANTTPPATTSPATSASAPMNPVPATSAPANNGTSATPSQDGGR